MKTCTVCKESKELSDYYRSSREKDGFSYRCKACDNRARYKSRNRNKKDNPTKLGYKRRWMMLKYGLDYGEFERMLEAQDYKCAICRTENPMGEGVEYDKLISFSVDHCHTSGKVRGLLCNLCNRALGLFKDSVESLEKAKEYLIKSKEP